MDAAAKEILTKLKAGKYDPVYVLQGEETFYIDLIADYIEAHAIQESERSFNQVIAYGKDLTVAAILTNARRFPMMAPRQLVIVREAQEIIDLQKEVGSKLMLDYITKPVPSTILVLCHKHKTLDKRKELGKKIDKLTTSATFKKTYENQLPPFVSEYVKNNGYAIDEAAVRILCEYVGNDLNRMANEIDKVLIVVPAGESITADKVMSQVGISREYNIFELQKALIQKDSFAAGKIVNYFESNTKKNPAIPLVAFLYSFFSKLLVASTASDRSESGLVSSLKISPYAVRDYSAALQRYDTLKILENISSLKQADLKLKGVNSGSETEGQILKELVFKLMY
ncbi:MAG: DNA polymerase III subunit delta [Bacteroidia bacterium]|nr:DNA polymerase III subunit delta [Bacteroidia bacterium]